MTFLPIHNYYLLNRRILLLESYATQQNQKHVYEVIRITEGVPLFFEDHLSRLHQSAQLAGLKINLSPAEIRQSIFELIKANKVDRGNIYLAYDNHLTAFFISHKYPDAQMYRQGVCCGILPAERNNPQAKVLQANVRKQADDLIATAGFYEVLLTNRHGYIMEGSRSNVFFVEGNSLITPPAAGILLGVTRKKILELAVGLGFQIKEEMVHTDDLGRFQAAFLTGTSPGVLPIRQINHVNYHPDDQVVQKLITAYAELVSQYIHSFNKKNDHVGGDQAN